MRQTASEAFRRAVDIYCDGLDTVAIGCRGERCEYAEGDPNHRCEAGFSRSQCDSCGSTLGGDRLAAVGLYHDDGGQLVDIDMEVCVDCAMYHANGELPEEWHDA